MLFELFNVNWKRIRFHFMKFNRANISFSICIEFRLFCLTSSSLHWTRKELLFFNFFLSSQLMSYIRGKNDINDNLKWREIWKENDRKKEEILFYCLTIKHKNVTCDEILSISPFFFFFSLFIHCKTNGRRRERGELIKIQSAWSRTIGESMHWLCQLRWEEKRRKSIHDALIVFVIYSLFYLMIWFSFSLMLFF